MSFTTKTHLNSRSLQNRPTGVHHCCSYCTSSDYSDCSRLFSFIWTL